MSSKCLRTIQKESFIKIIDRIDKRLLDTSSDDKAPIVWKILVLDASSQKIIGPLLKLNELYEHNVTLHL